MPRTAGYSKMLATILDKWSHDLGALPKEYITYDLETTGVDCEQDLIVELGYCAAIDGKAAEYHNHVLDWTRVRGVDQTWLHYKLEECAKHMRKQGRTYHMSYERMKAEGSHPEVVIQDYKAIFDYAKENNIMIVGHNAVNFDNKFIEQAVYEWLQVDDWKFPEYVFDTAAVVKATQLELPPYPEETLSQYFSRVLELPVAGVKYNLDTYCVKEFNLLDKFPSLDVTEAHSAGFDAMLVHLLLEEFR